MLKFLRKYNKWILVVGGAMLMVAFLMPQMLQELGKGAGARTTYARIAGSKVSMEDLELANHELIALRELQLMDRRQSVDWWLLVTREAERAGLVGGVQSGRGVIPELANEVAMRIQFQAQMQGQQPDMQQIRDSAHNLVEQSILRAASEARLTPDQAFITLAKVQAVSRLQQSYNNGLARVSDRRLILAGKDSLDAAKIDYLFIPGDRAVTFGAGTVPTPDDAALAALFERFKAVKKGEGDFGIGYTLPPRIKLEWIKLDRQAWGEKVRVDPLEVANRYLRENKGKPNLAASGPEFDAARTTIEASMRKETLDRMMAEAIKTVRAETAKATIKLERNGEYFVLPADWDQRRPDLNKLRDQIPDRVKTETRIDIAPPDVALRAAAWLTAEDLAQLPGVGPAVAKRGNNSIPLSQLAMQVKEIADTSPLGIQARVLFGPIEDQAGNQYFVTILDARKESAPDAWTEARELLEKDYRKLEGYKLLEQHTEALARQAATDGLDAMARLTLPTPIVDSSDAKTAVEVRKGVSVSRQGSQSPEINTDEFKKAVVTAASKFDPTVDLNIIDPAQRTLVLPIAKSLGVAVVRISGYTPLTNEKLRQSDFTLARQVQTESLKDLKDNPFSLARLRERLKVEYPGRTTPPEDEKPEDAAPSAGM